MRLWGTNPIHPHMRRGLPHAPTASPDSPPSNTQAGLSGCAPVLTLISSSGVLGDRLTRRTGALWVLEHWPERPLRGSLGSSWGGRSRVKVLTESSCPYSRCPWCRPSCLHTNLQSETCVVMPRGHNNKYHARVKRHQVWTQRCVFLTGSQSSPAELSFSYPQSRSAQEPLES